MLLGFIVPFISMIKPSVANMNLALNLAYAGLSLNLFKVSLTRPDEHTAKNQGVRSSNLFGRTKQKKG